MSERSCRRTWQAEAIEDGRLSLPDVASFERHARTCRDCTHQLRALAHLREAAPLINDWSTTPMERRRRRNDLLRRVAEPTRAPKLTAPRLLGGIAAVLSVLVMVLWSALSPKTGEELDQGSSTAQKLPRRATAPAYEVRASEGSVWSAVEEGASVRVIAPRGRFEFSVRRLEPEQRFVVDLPDGEIEVKGTEFVVHVQGADTREVRVTEGLVALRLSGHEPRLLAAGQTWVNDDVGTAPGSSDAAPPSSAPATSTTRPSLRRTVAPGSIQSTQSKHHLPPDPREVPPERQSPFALAMAAFSRGDYARAEALFGAFEREQPQDSRIEDALFLRALSRWRRGDRIGAREVLQVYLQRYPDGLRSSEAERLLME